MTAAAADAFNHYLRLARQVDAFFDRVHKRHGSEMDCARGCHDCCAPGLTITTVEAALIAELLETLEPEARAALAGDAAAATDQDPGCVALAADGSCRIYEARPLVCRSHGVPVLESVSGKGLPVINVCERNFKSQAALEATEGDCRLQGATLAMRLLAIDSAFADARGTPRGERVALTEIVKAG